MKTSISNSDGDDARVVRSNFLLLIPTLVFAGYAVGALITQHWTVAGVSAIIVVAGVMTTLLTARNPPRTGTRTHVLAADPALLARKRKTIAEELGLLEDAQELQRGVFEVSAELVGCVEETDARARFAAAMRRYWSCASADLMVWDKGTWRSLGGNTGEPPLALNAPVQLPEEANGDLVLDLSPGVSGQAALMLRRARPQPSLAGRSTADQRYVAEVLRTQLSLSLKRVVLYGGLQSLARLDPLTTAHRRWYGETRLKELTDVGEVVAVAMVDIDHFKQVNDEYGHAAGDLVLAAVGRALAAHLRTGDLVCRFGGEEFLVILPDTPPAGALQVSERLRAAVAALSGLPRQVTVSIGIAACLQDDTDAALIERADSALYAAKSGGRNRVVVSDEGGADNFLRTTSRRNRGSLSGTRRALSDSDVKKNDSDVNKNDGATKQSDRGTNKSDNEINNSDNKIKQNDSGTKKSETASFAPTDPMTPPDV